jgi:hypothetical protein
MFCGHSMLSSLTGLLLLALDVGLVLLAARSLRARLLPRAGFLRGVHATLILFAGLATASFTLLGVLGLLHWATALAILASRP